MKSYTIAVASGKGGTGKTTIAVSLALALNDAGYRADLIDADAEEPNAHLFLNPEFDKPEDVKVTVPRVINDRCTACGMCREICAFNAIIIMDNKPLIFDELCHSCGACIHFCPEEAMVTEERTTGWIERARSRGLDHSQGRLKVGEAMVVPIIKKLVKSHSDAEFRILDAPPGTSCPVIAAATGADYLLLVTEPTPFGLNDLTLAVELSRTMKIPFGVIINRSDLGDKEVVEYLKREQVPVLMEIPFDRTIAEGYAKGRPLMDVRPDLTEKLVSLAVRLREEAAQ